MTNECDEPATIGILHNNVKYIRESVDELKTQVKITNGRVGSLERWRSYIIGFCACLTVIVIPFVVYAVTRILDAIHL